MSQISDNSNLKHKQPNIEFINFDYFIKSLAIAAYSIKSNDLLSEVDKVNIAYNLRFYILLRE